MSDFASLAAALAGRYAIEREIGAGGMATVYLAQDLKYRRPVAVKVLASELGAVLGAARFLREIEISAQLRHPHILPLYDSGEAAGLLYYVMPYVEGESLRDRLTREKQLPLDDALRITREAADALSYAHSRGVVHRDIKPENVLLESGHAVVADFGIARAIGAADRERLTSTGIAIGTPAYMSPEQAAGSGDVDGRSDLYSLGCLLYEMLAGQPPFTGPTVDSVVHQHLAVEPPNITGIRPSVPAAVAAVLQRALAKTPADRFSTIALFEEALGERTSAASASPSPAGARSPRPRRSWQRAAALGLVAVAVVLGVLTVGRRVLPRRTDVRRLRTAIAVLPFENLSARGEQAYFAPGLQDELLTELSKVAALTVISRTSVMGYAGTVKPIRQIADELGVGTVVEGSVQAVGSRLRVNVQLVDAATDSHLWAEHYDRTLSDAFAVQSDIARSIVAAVGATLTSTDAGAIAAVPTANPEAYQLYLRGRVFLTRPGTLRPNVERARGFFERAVVLDPSFALAHAALSETYGRLHRWRYDPSPLRAARQRSEAETALKLAPTLPQAHAAMGLAYYWGVRDYPHAMAEFRIALKGLPSDVRLWGWISSMDSRMGRWQDALEAFQRAARLDPRNANLFLVQGGPIFDALRRYPEAVEAFDRALSLAPDLLAATVYKGWTYFHWEGRLDTLRAVLKRVPRDADLGLFGTRVGVQLALLFLERQPDSILDVLASAHAATFEDAESLQPRTLYAAWAYRWRGDRAAARAAFDSARAFLDSVVRQRPDDWRVHVARGLAVAGLGRVDEARREARWLQQSQVYRADAFTGSAVAVNRALVLAQAGDAGSAVAELERWVSRPAGPSVQTLRLNPLWDPIRHDPRFQALLAGDAGR